MLTERGGSSETSFVTLGTVRPPRCCSDTTQRLLCGLSFLFDRSCSWRVFVTCDDCFVKHCVWLDGQNCVSGSIAYVSWPVSCHTIPTHQRLCSICRNTWCAPYAVVICLCIRLLYSLFSSQLLLYKE